MGLGEACAGQVIVVEVKCCLWIVVTLSSEGNLGADPPTGSVTQKLECCDENIEWICSETKLQLKGAHPSIQATIFIINKLIATDLVNSFYIKY